MRWIRLYGEVLHDRKVQRLSAENFRGWINVLLVAGEHNGRIPELADIAFALRLTETQAERLADALVKAGLLERDGEAFVPHNWSARQYASDSSAERMQRHRDRQRTAESDTLDRHRDATPPSQVTDISRHLARHSDAIEQNRDRTETEQTPLPPEGEAAARRFVPPDPEIVALYTRCTESVPAFTELRLLKKFCQLTPRPEEPEIIEALSLAWENRAQSYAGYALGIMRKTRLEAGS